jgi:glucose-6-phosphate dehydrogenase assembly protein OpcA
LIAFRDREESGESAKPFRAWISAQCAVPFAGAPDVCCEAIAVGAREDALIDLPNTLVSLMVPDLPVFVYVRAFQPADRELVDRIARFTDLIIVDSHSVKDAPAAREQLMNLLVSPPGGVAVRDLNWSRVTPWRELVAEFFDSPSDRHYLDEIAEVEVARSVAAPGNIPTRTLLLTGWLASRLHWQPLGAERLDDRWISRWQSRGGEVTVRFTGTLSESREAAGISSLVLRTRSGATFTVAHDRRQGRMTATSSIDGRNVVHSVPEEPTDEATLLIRELSITGEDSSLKAALAEALALERRFHG